MAFREIDVENMPLTLDIAKQFDRMPTLLGDRDPDSARGKRRVADLHAVLASGLFYSPVWATVVVKSQKGKKYREDGGHSARMLVQTGNFPEGLSVSIRKFECDTFDDALILYEQFNASLSTRSTNDLVKNRAAYEPGLRDMKATWIIKALYGVRYYITITGVHTDIKILDLIRPYASFIQWVLPFVKLHRMNGIGTVAAMYATWSKSGDDATTFWTQVVEESGESPKDATRQMSRFLIKAIAEVGVRKQPTAAYYARSINAWNAFRGCRQISVLKYHKDANLPRAL